MDEILGVAAAILSSALGGTAVGATRYVVGACDPLTLGAFRFGIGFVFLLPLAALQRSRFPSRSDWPGIAGLGLLFFGLFPVLFNASLLFTTAARGALALSTLPLLTLLAAGMLGVEPLTTRKTLGVFLAMGGVAIALFAGLGSAPPGAWRGDLLMGAAAFCMALYNVGAKPFIRRSAALPFTALGMGVGTLVLSLLAWMRGGFDTVGSFGTPQWAAIAYLGVLGSALTFFLWAFALGRATPTRVAISVTVNPITASLVGALLLGEPIRWNLAAGLVTVALGIGIALSTRRSPIAVPSRQARPG